MSTFRVDVVPVHLETHPNADALSLVTVMGYTVVVRTDDWTEGELGAYIPPDSVVPDDDPRFDFLEKKRITVRRFRNVYSEGLLVKPPPGAKEGDDVAEQMRITHYEPVVRVSTSAADAKPPKARRDFPVYDVENIKRFPHVLEEGEEVVVTEKIHGANARYNYSDGEYHVGSRRRWVRAYKTTRVYGWWAKMYKKVTGHLPKTWGFKTVDNKEGGVNPWWRAMEAEIGLKLFLQDNPHITVYGEIYGPVQELRYGVTGDRVALAVFDAWDSSKGEWLDWRDLSFPANLYGFPLVPVLFTGPFDKEVVTALSFGVSNVEGADHYKEGVVVKPLVNRRDSRLGRVQLKVINNEYLEGKKKGKKKK